MGHKSTSLFTAAVAASLAVDLACAEEPTIDLNAQATTLVKEYATALQAALKDAMGASGPVGAISFCHDQAPQIAANISQSSGWTVGRTSLRVRNASSSPDEYETKAMEEFLDRIAKGEAVTNLVKGEIIQEKGAKVFRFVKAIPTTEVCLTCHGAKIKPEIKAKLDELYPGDKATGFGLGDMRGVFTLSKRL